MNKRGEVLIKVNSTLHLSFINNSIAAIFVISNFLRQIESGQEKI